MLTKRKIRHWEAAVRQQAYDNARALAAAIAAGTAWAPPPYDLGIVLEPGEIVWHRCPASYRWRVHETWAVHTVTRGTDLTRPLQTSYLWSEGMTDWLVTNIRLATRLPGGRVISVYWTALEAVSVGLDAGLVVLDGHDGYHGELSGPAIAPVSVAAVASCYGIFALLVHPGLAALRGVQATGSSRCVTRSPGR